MTNEIVPLTPAILASMRIFEASRTWAEPRAAYARYPQVVPTLSTYQSNHAVKLYCCGLAYTALHLLRLQYRCKAQLMSGSALSV